MKFKLDTEKRNLLRQAVFRNHRPAVLLQIKVSVIHQVKLELLFLQARGKISEASYTELEAKYNQQLVKLYENFAWNSLKKAVYGQHRTHIKPSSI